MSAILALRYSFVFCLCGYSAKFCCDWKTELGKCAKLVCDKHATKVGADKHLCPFHKLQYESWKRRHPEKVAAVESGTQASLFEGAQA